MNRPRKLWYAHDVPFMSIKDPLLYLVGYLPGKPLIVIHANLPVQKMWQKAWICQNLKVQRGHHYVPDWSTVFHQFVCNRRVETRDLMKGVRIKAVTPSLDAAMNSYSHESTSSKFLRFDQNQFTVLKCFSLHLKGGLGLKCAVSALHWSGLRLKPRSLFSDHRVHPYMQISYSTWTLD